MRSWLGSENFLGAIGGLRGEGRGGEGRNWNGMGLGWWALWFSKISSAVSFGV